jgi:tetratricopeptide (TPR) repeat protein
MGAFAILLDKFCEKPSSLSTDQRLRAYHQLSEPTLEDVWRGWCEAERAIRAEQPELAHAWVDAGWVHLQGNKDNLCELEFLTLEARILTSMDEPRDALGPAHESAQRWRNALEDIGIPQILESVRVLLATLAKPHPAPEMSDVEILLSWNEDRYAPVLDSSAKQLMEIYGDLRAPEEAARVAEEHVGWLEANAARIGMTSKATAPILASIEMALGDVFDRCRDHDKALETFETGLSRLKDLPPSPSTDWLRAQLEFNLAGQMARQGRFAEAEAAYTRVERDLAAMGEEPVLRVRYARIFTRYQRGLREGLTDELIAIAEGYEAILEATTSTEEEIQARQGLDLVYRLLLRLRVDEFDTDDADEVHLFLLLVFALKEEEGKFARLVRRAGWAESREGARFHSEITILIERMARQPSSALLLIEQVPGAVLFITMRAGTEPWHRQVHVTVVEEAEVEALTDLITRHGDNVSALSDRAIPVRSAPGEAFVAACRRAWDLLSLDCRTDLTDVDRIYHTVDYQTDIDLLPVDLLHDGRTFLGLRACLARAPSLRDLTHLLGENLMNAAPTGQALIIRAEDALSQAASEVETVAAGVGTIGKRSETRTSPAPAALLNELGEGVDLMHYVGHGLADKIGEELPLGPSKRLLARDIQSLGDAPAPVTVVSACLAGRGRHLRSGEQQGFVTALLRRGSPAVFAAQFPVPDFIGALYWGLFYHFAAGASLGDAMLATRKLLAAQGYHPAVWSSFALFGRPAVRLEVPHRSEATAWPSRVLRLVTTAAAEDRTAATVLLAADARLSEATRVAVRDDIEAFFEAPAAPLDESNGRSAVNDELHRYGETSIAVSVLRCFVRLRHSSARPDGWSLHDDLSLVDLGRRMLADSYLLVAVAIEICRDLSQFFSGRRQFLLGAARRHWLNGDPNLAGQRAELAEAAELLKKNISVDLAEIAGVDPATFRAADEGNRDALKRVLSSMWTREARPEAVLSDDWRPWLLNAIGDSSTSGLPDALGAIDKACRDGRLSEAQAAALVTLIERFVGPGEIEPEYAEAARRLFERQQTELTVLDLFLLHDRIASHLPCDDSEIETAAERATALSSPSAAAYFLGVLAERAFRDDRVQAAYEAATRARALHAEAAAADLGVAKRHGRLLFLFAQIANRLRRGDEAREAIGEGLKALEEVVGADNPEARLSAYIDLEVQAAILLLMLEGRSSEARDLFRRAERFIDDGIREEIEAMIGSTPVFPEDVDAVTRHGSDELHEGHYLTAIEWLGEGAARLETQGDTERRCGVLGDLAVAFKNAGNWARAEATYYRVIDLCRAEGDDINLSRWTQNMGMMLLEAGDLEQGRRFLEGGLAAAERSGSAYQISCGHGNLGVARVNAGDFAGAADSFEKALQTSPREYLTEQWRQSLFSTLAQWGTALVEVGDIAAAIAAHERLVAAFDAYGGELSFAAVALLHLAVLLGDNLRMADGRAAVIRARELFQAAGDDDGARTARALEEQLTRGKRGAR